VIRSMTGFGSGEVALPGGSLRVEIRSVNAKFHDARIRMPREYAALESELLERLRGRLQRGHVQVSVERRAEGEGAVVADLERARAYVAACRELAEDLDLPGELDLQAVASADGVLRPAVAVDELDAVRGALFAAMDQAIVQVEALRSEEGRNLVGVLQADLQHISEQMDAIRQSLPGALQAQRERLIRRIEELAGEVVDPARAA